MTHITYAIPNMSCPACVMHLEALEDELDGVKAVRANYKKQRMDATIGALGRLVEYEITEVTAAATYYMAETYYNFSRSLAESERPTRRTFVFVNNRLEGNAISTIAAMLEQGGG